MQGDNMKIYKTESIQLRVSQEVKDDMKKTAEYYGVSLSSYITLLHRYTQDKDTKSIINLR